MGRSFPKNSWVTQIEGTDITVETCAHRIDMWPNHYAWRTSVICGNEVYDSDDWETDEKLAESAHPRIVERVKRFVDAAKRPYNPDACKGYNGVSIRTYNPKPHKPLNIIGFESVGKTLWNSGFFTGEKKKDVI